MHFGLVQQEELYMFFDREEHVIQYSLIWSFSRGIYKRQSVTGIFRFGKSFDYRDAIVFEKLIFQN